MATRKRSSRKTGDSGNFGLGTTVGPISGTVGSAGSLAPKITIEQPQEPLKAIDHRIKSIGDIDLKKLQALVEKTFQLGFTGTVNTKLEQIGVPQGGSYPLASITFKAANGAVDTYDIGLFMAYPEITWQEMRNVHLLPVVGINFAK